MEGNSVTLFVSLLLGALVLLCLYMKSVYSYWRRKGVQHFPLVYFFGNYLDAVLLKINSGLVYDRVYRGSTELEAVGMYTFYMPRLLVRSLELVKRVMVSDFSSFHDNEFYVTERLDPLYVKDPFVLKGEEWKQYRVKMASMLTQNKVKDMFPMMKNIIPLLDTYLKEHKGKDVEAKELSTLFTMENVSNIVFGTSGNCFTDTEAPFRVVSDTMTEYQMRIWWKTLIIIIIPKFRSLFNFRFVPKCINDYVETMVQTVDKHRRTNNVTRNDLFQYLMKMRIGDDDSAMISYGVAFYLEAFESSAMVASAALYELACNPDVQQTLYDEIKESIGDKDDYEYETIVNLSYLEKVIQEAQRLYPVVYAFSRQCSKPTTLPIGGKDVAIEPGTPVIVPVYSIHHDPLYWPNPDVFDPDRFNEENTSARPQYTFMPFGEGPRACPGMRFGICQVKLFLAHLVYKYRILRTERTPKKLSLATGSYLLTIKEKEWIRIEQRN